MDKLKAKIGLCIMYPAPGVIERVGPDWDWIWLDGQHGQLGGYTEILNLVRACDLIGRPAFLRVPGHDAGMIGLSLDMNVAGVIIPQVDTVEQARAAVRAAKFPPLGNRSYGSRRNIDFEGRSYSDMANEKTMLICQIESPEALAEVDALAAVPGVDGLFIGADDLFLRRGVGMNEPRDKELIQQDFRRLLDACARHGKQAFGVGVGKEMAALSVKMGFQWVISGSDVAFVAASSKAAAQEARSAIESAGAETPAAGRLKPATIY